LSYEAAINAILTFVSEEVNGAPLSS